MTQRYNPRCVRGWAEMTLLRLRTPFLLAAGAVRLAGWVVAFGVGPPLFFAVVVFAGAAGVPPVAG